jgi:hypothetical protein
LVTMGSSRESSQRRTVIILLALVVAVGIAAVVVLATLAPGSRGESESGAAAVIYGAPTALDVYPVAREAALQWADDAQLASAAGAWTQPIDMGMLNAGRTSWSFFFYSRSRGEVATVTGMQTGSQLDAEFISAMPYPAETTLLSDVGWVFDSGDAVRILLENGGAEFMSGREDQVAINLRLSTAASNGRILWIGSVIYGADPDLSSIVVEVDATSGEVQNVH